MKTQLPEKIENAAQAVEFLTQLFKNGESFHPEDDAHGIVWAVEDPPTPEECDKLNDLMSDIYDLSDVDPCGILLELLPVEGND